ncbi:MAG: beta-mannosidase [Ktedonobacterales bacterium]
MQRLDLLEHWYLKQRDPEKSLDEDCAEAQGWLPATVPGVVQQDLLSQGLIPDPYQQMNESAVQWVGERDWIYRCRFAWTPEHAEQGETMLCFGGLDTVATVWLNGRKILASDNMFVVHRIPVQAHLHAGENELLILFESVLRVGRERETGMKKMPVWNGDSSRVYVRKAQYHYGWDFGPCLLTAGPWQPVWLEHASARIAEFNCPAKISEDLRHAQLPVRIAIEHPERLPLASLELTLYDPDGHVLGETTFARLDDTLQHTFLVERPELWWPHGYGSQSRYRLVAGMCHQGVVIEQRTLQLGLRRLQLLQEDAPGEAGKSFRFEVNNTPIFCGGANWIPADMMLARVSADRYRAYLRQAVDAHMVMIRVWGGGIYETDIFYDICDELGLLVWQDFLFACGIYPAHETFLQSVRSEAECAIRRLRHHPSLALWCGNNEDYDIAGQQGRPLSGPVTESFPARIIYEELLPELCARLDPARPYWPGSPYAGADSNDPDEGDRHVWNVWHRALAPYQEYPKYGGRFVSEFGMVGLPSASAIGQMASPAERYPGSRALDFHFKADQGIRRLAVYLSENVPVPADIVRYTYATQLVQAEALAAALRGWRRQFQGPRHYRCGGALLWQLNDFWPSISWSIIDAELFPKMAYYAVRRALAPLALEIAGDFRGASALWAANNTSAGIAGRVEVRRWSLQGRIEGEEERLVVLAPHQATELGGVGLAVDSSHVLQARLWVSGKLEASASLWSEPLRYLTVSNPELDVEFLPPGELRLLVKAPAKSVWLEAEGHPDWSDNGFDLFPGDAYVIHAMNFTGRLTSIQSLFDLQSARQPG